MRAVGIAGLLQWAAPVPAADAAPEAASLEAAFHTCVGMKDHPIAGALMRAVGDAGARDAFVSRHAATVAELSVERSPGYTTLTARLAGRVSIAGAPVSAIYAATCEQGCPLAIWGLELDGLSAAQRNGLERWVRDAPTTDSGSRGPVKVQLNTTTDGATVLVCDLSG